MNSKKKNGIVLSQYELNKVLERKKLNKRNLDLTSKSVQSQPIASENTKVELINTEITFQGSGMI